MWCPLREEPGQVTTYLLSKGWARPHGLLVKAHVREEAAQRGALRGTGKGPVRRGARGRASVPCVLAPAGTHLGSQELEVCLRVLRGELQGAGLLQERRGQLRGGGVRGRRGHLSLSFRGQEGKRASVRGHHLQNKRSRQGAQPLSF